MSEKSKRQRKFLDAARITVMARYRQVLENPELDDEDISTLFEIELAKQVAGAMYWNSELGDVSPGADIEQLLNHARSAIAGDSEKSQKIEQLKEENAALRKKVEELHQLAGRSNYPHA